MMTTPSFAQRERAILENIAEGKPLRASLVSIVELVEQRAPGMFCSILLLDDDGRTVRTGAAPSLPEAWVRALDGQQIGPTAGSCGTAAFRRERVIVEDIATHPYWHAYKSAALTHDLRACWSSPIFSAERDVLGTFAMYYRDIRGPSADEITWVDAATHLASIAIARDRADARVHRGEALLSLVYDNVADVIFYLAVEGPDRYRVLSANPAFEKTTGIACASIVGRLLHEVMPPESLDVILAKYRHAVTSGENVTWEYAAGYPKGLKIGEVTLCPVHDARGVCTNIVSTVHDVTTRKNSEREREDLHAKVAHAQRMQALGTLAGGIAHDFNNILSVILSYAEIVSEDLKTDDPLGEDVCEIRKAAVRATEMTRQLLAFSRHQVLEPRVVDPNCALAGMTRMLRRLLGADIDLSVVAAPDIANIRVDPTQLEQILMNLAINARDAMPKGGALTIETSNVVLDSGYARQYLDAVPGDYVMLAVSDNGIGMDRATQERIFEPFFTTKERGKGTGLGLATVFGIVKQSGGTIGLHSEPREGATFKIYLPAVNAAIDEVPARRMSAAVTGSETILVVEDDEQVRALATEILRRNGYRVLDASNGDDALVICEKHGSAVDLLLADVVMPRMGGPQLAERLLALHPRVIVLFMSGYTDDASFPQSVQGAGVHYLQKPITPSSLLQKVRTALDGERRARLDAAE